MSPKTNHSVLLVCELCWATERIPLTDQTQVGGCGGGFRNTWCGWLLIGHRVWQKSFVASLQKSLGRTSLMFHYSLQLFPEDECCHSDCDQSHGYRFKPLSGLFLDDMDILLNNSIWPRGKCQSPLLRVWKRWKLSWEAKGSQWAGTARVVESYTW